MYCQLSTSSWVDMLSTKYFVIYSLIVVHLILIIVPQAKANYDHRCCQYAGCVCIGKKGEQVNFVLKIMFYNFNILFIF